MEWFIYKCKNSILFIFINCYLIGHGLNATTSKKCGHLNTTEVGDINGHRFNATTSAQEDLLNTTEVGDIIVDGLNTTTSTKIDLINTTEIGDIIVDGLNTTTSTKIDLINTTEVGDIIVDGLNATTSTKIDLINMTEVGDIIDHRFNATTFAENDLLYTTEVGDLIGQGMNATTSTQSDLLNTTDVGDLIDHRLNATTSAESDLLTTTEVENLIDHRFNATTTKRSGLVNFTVGGIDNQITILIGDAHLTTTWMEKQKTNTTKEAACGPIESKPSEKETCYIDDAEVICPNSSRSGSVIRRECRPGYLPYLPQDILYGCYNGHWNPRYDLCTPDCGLPTRNNKYPWMVAIYDKNEDLTCAGIIISPFHVITSTHSFETSYKTGEKAKMMHPENYLLIAGKHYTNIHKGGGSSQKRRIKYATLVDTETYRLDADLLLLEVDREFEFSDGNEVRPICMDWDGVYEELDFKDGNEGISVGWEYDKDQVVPCNFGNRFNVQYWQRHTCVKNLEILNHHVSISPTLFCAEFINTNNSDCGKGAGSAIFFKSNGKKYFLRGLLYPHPWLPVIYQLYDRIPFYHPWLKDEIRKHPRIRNYFKTSDWIPSKETNGCILPENVEHGKFTLTSGNNYVAAKWVPSTTTLLLSCVGSTNASPLSFRCTKNVWLPSVDRVSCRPPATCPSILTTTSERVACKLDGATISCKNPPNNATALVHCQPFYTYPGNRPIYKCQDGDWDQSFAPCTLECGMKRVSVTELIIGAQPAMEHEYPWVIGIYNSTDDHICGGTIIARKFVLSAAHCFVTRKGHIKDKLEFTIVAGKHYRDLGIDEPSAQKRKIKSLNIHPDYRASYHKYRDDIALIEVDGDFIASSEVEPVCVDWDNIYEDYDLTDGNLGVVTGWGHTTNAGAPSEVLKKLVVPFRDKRVCSENLPVDFSQQFLVEDKICAGYRDNDTNVCKGDSGGGLYFKSDDRRYFIRGIVSITVRSEVGCDPNRFALYTKVSTYLSWLESMTRRVY